MIQMGVVLANERKFKEAEDVFRKCYDLNPPNCPRFDGAVGSDHGGDTSPTGPCRC